MSEKKEITEKGRHSSEKGHRDQFLRPQKQDIDQNAMKLQTKEN